MGMLQPVGINRVMMSNPLKYGTSVDGTIGHSANDDNWGSGNNAFIADTNVDDVDTGWGVEMFVPWTTLNLSAPTEGDTVDLAILVTVYDRGNTIDGASWTNDHGDALGAHGGHADKECYMIEEILDI